MILKEAINNLDDDEMFCLGAASSFFFIGYKSEWIKDEDVVGVKIRRALRNGINHKI